MKFVRTAVDEVSLMPEDDREEYEERAAILEYEAKMDRRDAEALALEMCRKQLTLFA
jgi:hypothetical protein